MFQQNIPPREAQRLFRRQIIDLVLSSVTTGSERAVSLVQIGAHDGRMVDPAYAHLSTKPWNGLLIEPHPVYFSELEKNYSGNQNVELVNLGVSDVAARRELYHVNEQAKNRYPREARGCASFEKKRLVDALNRVNDKRNRPLLESDVASTEVRLERLETILAQYSVSKIDVLVIDVEGHERSVLASADLASFGIKVAIVECNGPDVVYEEEIAEKLKQLDLTVLRLGDNLVGYKAGSVQIPLEAGTSLAGIRVF